MAMREFLRFTKEATFGTFNGTPGTGEQFWVTLPGPNSFTMRPVPIRYSIRDPGGLNRRRLTGTEQIALSGRLMTVLHPSQADKFLNTLLTTSGTREELGSFTLDHAFLSEASSAAFLYKRYLGCKAKKVGISCSNEGENVKTMVNVDVIGSTPATITVSDMATPAPSNMASDLPYTFQDTSGALVLASTARTQYSSFSLEVNNILDLLFDESQYAGAIRFCGRDINFSFRQRLNLNTDRTTFEGVTAFSTAVTFNNGTNTAVFTLGSRNFFTSLEDDLQLDKAYYRTINSEVYLDTSLSSGAGNDLVLSFT